MWRIAEGGWLYIVADPKRAGRSLVALSVPDLDAACAEIAQRGVHVDSMETVSDAARKAAEAALPVFEARGNLWWASRTLWGLLPTLNAMGEWRIALDW